LEFKASALDGFSRVAKSEDLDSNVEFSNKPVFTAGLEALAGWTSFPAEASLPLS